MTPRVLLATPRLRVAELRCRKSRSGCSAARGDEPPHLALFRRGAFAYHVGPRAFLGDATTALLHAGATEYRVSHPGPDGDDLTIVELHDDTAAELFGRAPAVPWPVAAATQLRHQRLAAALARGTADALEAEEAVLALLLEIARVAAAAPRVARRERRLAERAKERLHAGLDRNVPASALAAELGVSPFHLMRVFRRATGHTLRGWRRRVRVLEALARLADGERDLAAVAVSVGFAHHSHLTASCRRVLGEAPGALRRALAPTGARARS